MSKKTFKSILYHITFHTKGNEPLITSSIEDKIYHFIWNKCKKLGLYLYRIGGIENHVHLLIYIPPQYSISEIIGKIKGASSYFINQELPGEESLYWQRGFGVLTISRSDFNRVYNYVKNQKIHHRDNDLMDEYEILNSNEDK